MGGRRKSLRTVDRGYYIANIRYDLFCIDEKEKDSLEDRILFFIRNADKDEITSEDGWFMLNFPLNFKNYLSNVYKVNEIDLNKKHIERIKALSLEREEDLNRLFTVIDNVGNDKEKLILNELIDIILMNN